jgi:hypothetical protein
MPQYVWWIIFCVILAYWYVQRIRALIRLREELTIRINSNAEFSELEFENFGKENRDLVNSVAGQLASLGFVALGNCANSTTQLSIWVRGEDTAEFVHFLDPKRTPGMFIGFGREFTDGGSIAVFNAPVGTSNDHKIRTYFLQVGWDLAKLDKVSKAIIAREPPNREFLTPTNAIAYKKMDRELLRQAFAGNSNYKLNLKRDCYQPRWIYLLRVKKIAFAQTAKNRSELYAILAEPGLEDIRLQIMGAPPRGAFPVIALEPSPDTPPSCDS